MDIQSNSQKLINLLLFLSLGAVGCLAALFYFFTQQPIPNFYAVTAENSTSNLYPLSAPILSPGNLLQWAHGVAILAYTYNFVNYREVLNELRLNFTETGWHYFERALELSGSLSTVIAKKLVVSAVAVDSPVILERAIISGRYSWKIQIPLLVSYQSSNQQTQRSVIVTMIISRVSTREIPKGIAVVSFMVTEGKTDG